MIEITNNITGEVTYAPDPVAEESPAAEIPQEVSPEEKLAELQMQLSLLQAQIESLAAELGKGG